MAPDRLNDPAFMAAQTVAALGEGWTPIAEPPEGEVLWREAGDQVRLTPDGWLVYLIRGKDTIYSKRLRATDELVRALRGETGSGIIRPMKPVLRER